MDTNTIEVADYKIVFPAYLEACPRIGPGIDVDTLKRFDKVVFAKGALKERCYVLSWGFPASNAKNGVLETGFFWDAAHIDTVGLYKFSAFNTRDGWKEVEKFNAPASCKKVLSTHKVPDTKYRQTKHSFTWNKVVLALQNPRDRSVASVGSEEDYYDFVEGACKFYGKNLFLKAHPWNSLDEMTRLVQIAHDHKIIIAKTNHDVIKNCEFVLTYNSTFCVDCFVRGVPVVQFAPGYFYQTPAVKYTKFEYPKELGYHSVEYGYKVADFLVHRYCFNMAMPNEKWVEMAEHFAESKEIFPMNEKFSYANNIHYSKEI